MEPSMDIERFVIRTSEDDGVYKEAVFSKCLKYRYCLSRIWDRTQQFLYWLLLNPSTADQINDDPTVLRCQEWARRKGYGGTIVYNIFAYRAKCPEEMKEQDDPTGPDNDLWIKELAKNNSADIVAGWGNDGLHRQRHQQVLDIFNATGGRLLVLAVNQSGCPRHPLYVRYETEFSGLA